MLEFLQAHLYAIIGYVGSACVLISFLMSSVMKLRIINSVGCIVSVVYGFLIGAYPTIVMNGALLIINIVFLVRMAGSKASYSTIVSHMESDFVKYFLATYHQDILKFFPEFREDSYNYVRVTFCDTTVCGILIGNLDERGTLTTVLDYATPQYRDFSVGLYQVDVLRAEGIKRLTATCTTPKHANYLLKMGFLKNGDNYIKNLDLK